MSVNTDTIHAQVVTTVYISGIECMGIVFIKIAGIGKDKVKLKV